MACVAGVVDSVDEPSNEHKRSQKDDTPTASASDSCGEQALRTMGASSGAELSTQ